MARFASSVVAKGNLLRVLLLIWLLSLPSTMTTPKTSWADDVDELAEPITDYIDENGIRVTTELALNDEGKKVKVSE